MGTTTTTVDEAFDILDEDGSRDGFGFGERNEEP